MRNSKVKGFTLVELIVVIAIIAILAAILVPNMLGYIKNAKWTQADSNAKNVHTAATAALAQLYADGKIGAETGLDTSNYVALTDRKGKVNGVDVDLTTGLGETFEDKCAFWCDKSWSGVTAACWISKNSSAELPKTYPASRDKANEENIIGYYPAPKDEASK